MNLSALNKSTYPGNSTRPTNTRVWPLVTILPFSLLDRSTLETLKVHKGLYLPERAYLYEAYIVSLILTIVKVTATSSMKTSS